MIVVDASVMAVALGDDSAVGDAARRRLVGATLVAPHLLDAEVVAAWRRLVSSGELSDERARLAMVALRDLPVTRVPHSPLLERSWELRSNLTVYDALYVALAESLGAPLLTMDERLVRSPGPRCEFLAPDAP